MEGVIANQQPAIGTVVQDPFMPISGQESMTSAPKLLPRPVFYDLGVNNKVAYQPNFRNIMPVENMPNITQGYLVRQEQPDYIHPMAKDGLHPWKAKRDGGSSSSSSSTGATTSGST
ncbi:hypothetical protein BGZ97_011056 [Linnemannia gamsii]|uniref:Uncharacterized protein n=1 Tax=Linnemannia gamsii TaxID=64522 RepID=A0A9P6UNG5_9FUNG|nr:hypothetical protein BGZ97_011056 [Linnemannia gamsii]